MKLCLIPPIPNLTMANTGTQMVLAHLLFGDRRYTKFYRHRSRRGDFVILDNGAHEGPALPMRTLLMLAERIGASEVVVPDLPHDEEATWSLFLEAISWLETDVGQQMYIDAGRPRLMFIPHAPAHRLHFNTYLDFANRMHAKVADLPWAPAERFTMGVPLMYDLCFAGGLVALLDRLTWFVEESGVQIHLLGWSRNLDTPPTAADWFPSIRSVDTAKPFVYARNGIELHSLRSLAYPGRPNDYFQKPLSKEERIIAARNIQVFERALGTVSPVPEFCDSEQVPATHSELELDDSPRLPDTT